MYLNLVSLEGAHLASRQPLPSDPRLASRFRRRNALVTGATSPLRDSCPSVAQTKNFFTVGPFWVCLPSKQKTKIFYRTTRLQGEITSKETHKRSTNHNITNLNKQNWSLNSSVLRPRHQSVFLHGSSHLISSTQHLFSFTQPIQPT